MSLNAPSYQWCWLWSICTCIYFESIIHEGKNSANSLTNDTVAVFIPSSIYHANNVPEMFTWRSVLRNGVILTDWLSRFSTKIASRAASKATEARNTKIYLKISTHQDLFQFSMKTLLTHVLSCPFIAVIPIFTAARVFLYKCLFLDIPGTAASKLNQHPNFAGCHLAEAAAPFPVVLTYWFNSLSWY